MRWPLLRDWGNALTLTLSRREGNCVFHLGFGLGLRVAGLPLTPAQGCDGVGEALDLSL